jgi:hypothetical protein
MWIRVAVTAKNITLSLYDLQILFGGVIILISHMMFLLELYPCNS